MNLLCKSNLFIGIIIAAMFALSSCKGNQSTESSGLSSVINPLTAGNTWIYEYTYYDTLGNITQTTIDSTKIGRDTLIEGEVWHQTPIPSIYQFTNRFDGYYIRLHDIP